ncbi:hypothetical protein VSR34_06810 [Paraburkholderia sp. JHI2823]|uniref:hypothetical protein n=1 Tax=Paraburkholderia TaxID=1822464 RepID=UPI00042182D6|nr:hypothetical protein [Paraburkholderia mimosarum]
MKTYDFEQRLEEIQIALSRLFASPKSPAVSRLYEGNAVILHLSWVVESHRDTTLDSRCAATIHATRAQIERYAGLDTAQRRTIQQRIGRRVRSGYDAGRRASPRNEACAFDITLDDATFAARADGDYFPGIG